MINIVHQHSRPDSNNDYVRMKLKDCNNNPDNVNGILVLWALPQWGGIRTDRNTSTNLRGCMSVLEIVFVGQCEVFVCLDLVHFFPLAAKLIGPRTGCQFFKKFDFSNTYSLNSMSHLRGCVSVLEIVFVGQCEVFVCLDFLHFSSWLRSS